MSRSRKSLRKSTRKSRKSPQRYRLSPEKCEYPATTHGLKKWHQAMFEKLGWMILAKKKRYTEKVGSYLISLSRLQNKLECKIQSVKDEDKKNDLKIMLVDVNILVEHAKRDLA